MPVLAQSQEPATAESLEAWRTRIQSAVKAETSLLREIYMVESSEYGLLKEVQDREAHMTELTRRGIALREEVARLSEDVDRLNEKMRVSLNYMSRMMNRKNIVRMLLRSRSIESFLRRWRVVKRIAAEDRLRLLNYRARLNSLTAARLQLEQDRTRMAGLLAETQSRNRDILVERDKRLYLLSEIQRDRAIAEKTARDLASAREETSAAIAELTQEPPAPQPPEAALNLDFALRKGYLKLPVKGPIVSYFGPVRNEQLGTVTRNNGVDILAREGSPVSAVADGQVRFAGELKGYGRVVILDHGDRFHSLYGHLDRIQCRKGQQVRVSEVVGTVGSSGSLSGPRLHFEIRQKGVALDPLNWIEPGMSHR